MNRWSLFTTSDAFTLAVVLFLQSPPALSRTASSRGISTANLQVQPTPGTPAPGGIQSYRRFHANDSFVGRSIPCSDEEKICFRYNTLYEPKTGHCIFPPYNSHCVGDRQNFSQGSGRLHAVCPRNLDPCPGYRMAFDGRCYPKQIVRDVICGCPEPPTAHFLGGVECRCDPAAGPARVRQPPQRGRCRVPDLRFPISYKNTLLRRIVGGPPPPVFNLSCSAEQARCFSQEKLWVASEQGCFPLQKKGPCPDGHLVMLQKGALANASAVCRPENGGCAPGSFRMAFDGECHGWKEMEIVASWSFWRNFVGEFEIAFENTFTRGYPMVRNGTCSIGIEIDFEDSLETDLQFPTLNCDGIHSDACSVEAKAPLPN